MHMRIGPFLLGLLFLQAACAKVGDPLPPLVQRPDPPSSLELVQIGAGQVQLEFPLTPQADSVEVLRDCSGGTVASPPSTIIARIAAGEFKRRAGEDTVRFTDSEPVAGTPCVYSVRYVIARGQRSAPSPVARTEVTPAALPPRNLRHQVQPDRIVVFWDPPQENLDGSRPARVVGYLVNGVHFVETPPFEDREFSFGEVQVYRVQSVSRRAGPRILSDFSETLTVLPEDVFPPPPPAHLTAVPLQGTIQLFWDAVESPDLRGYYVYRGMSPDLLDRISPLITLNSYVDETVSSDVTYYYRVSSVDQSGNESPKSDLIMATVNLLRRTP